jgi:CheY-like chemotaxis protein
MLNLTQDYPLEIQERHISPVQFRLGDITNRIRHILSETGAEASLLGVEVTEGALLHDSERVAAALREMRGMGLEISLDDFGTGYSSLSRLRSLPIDILKVDRSFVSDVTAAPESASVTRSIINLAHGLQISVLAEGVETEGQLNMLVANGCDHIQGYFFSQPVSADEAAVLLCSDRCLPAHLTLRRERTRTLLLVDDDENILSTLNHLLLRDGYKILMANGGPQALDILATSEIDVIISDQHMPGMTGIDFLRLAKGLCPDSIRMTLSDLADLPFIVGAVNEGVVHKFLTKPWDDMRLQEQVADGFHQKELADENRRLSRELSAANADLAGLNRRLAQLAERQCEQAMPV